MMIFFFKGVRGVNREPRNWYIPGDPHIMQEIRRMLPMCMRDSFSALVK
jgi:hypothetical protein